MSKASPKKAATSYASNGNPPQEQRLFFMIVIVTGNQKKELLELDEQINKHYKKALKGSNWSKKWLRDKDQGNVFMVEVGWNPRATGVAPVPRPPAPPPLMPPHHVIILYRGNPVRWQDSTLDGALA